MKSPKMEKGDPSVPSLPLFESEPKTKLKSKPKTTTK